MGFVLTVLSFAVFAEEIVELEPVYDNGDTFRCSQYATIANCFQSGAEPGALAYCDWNDTSSPQKCIDDPQLRVLQEGLDCTASKDGVPGQEITVTGALTADCVASKGSGKICARVAKSASVYNYCVYAWLRDGVCPDSVCVRNTASSAEGHNRDQCIPSGTTECQMLSTEKECGLNPKCYYSGGSCQTDTCWTFGEIDPSTGVNCAGLARPTAGTCKDFHPLIGGEPKNYCVNKAQSNPNVCYFGTPGATLSASNDYGVTFPTYVQGSKTPSCSAPTGSTVCEGNGNCTYIVNVKGAFAGAYCTDGTHGDDAANILRIPSLLLLLALSLSLFAL